MKFIENTKRERAIFQKILIFRRRCYNDEHDEKNNIKNEFYN